MNKAELYHKTNQISRSDAEQLIKEFNKKFKWRTDANDSLLDAGCGPGDITKDIIMPILPDTFQRIIGVDISEEMINYARKTQIHPKLSFELFDLNVALEEQSLNGIEPVDHITSFYCLMWVQNQKTCLENLYKLLNPGGDILLVFLINHIVYDSYIHQSHDDRWTEYTNDYAQMTMPYYNSKNPVETFSSLMRYCGFIDCEVRVDSKIFAFDGAEMREASCAKFKTPEIILRVFCKVYVLQAFYMDFARYFLRSVSPFIDRIPADKKEDYLDDLISYLQPYASGNFHEGIEFCQLNLPYKILVAYARK